MSKGLNKEVRFAFLIEPPFCFRTPADVVTGCDVELARYILGKLGVKSFVVIETQFDQLILGLLDCRWDMTTGLFITSERQKQINFSRPIWALSDGLLVRTDDLHRVSGYRSLAKAEGLRLGVIRDQVQYQTALNAGVPHNRIYIFDTYKDAARAVADGKIDVYASVATAHRAYLAENLALRLAVVEVPLDEKPAEHGGFAFAKSNHSLRNTIDATLGEFLGTSEHWALIEQFGFTSNDVVSIVDN